MSTPDPATAALSLKNRANGHANSLPIPAVARWSYAFARRINTRLAGELAWRIFLSPPRSPYLDAQRAVLKQADRRTLNVMGHKACAYSWGSGPAGMPSQNANLDRHQRLRARRHRQKTPRHRGVALHNSTDSQPHAFRENAVRSIA